MYFQVLWATELNGLGDPGAAALIVVGMSPWRLVRGGEAPGEPSPAALAEALAAGGAERHRPSASPHAGAARPGQPGAGLA